MVPQGLEPGLYQLVERADIGCDESQGRLGRDLLLLHLLEFDADEMDRVVFMKLHSDIRSLVSKRVRSS